MKQIWNQDHYDKDGNYMGSSGCVELDEEDRRREREHEEARLARVEKERQAKEVPIHVVGDKMYAVCGYCKKMVCVNKRFFGSIHLCLTAEERQRIDDEIQTKT
jgi:hypothetical protein